MARATCPEGGPVTWVLGPGDDFSVSGLDLTWQLPRDDPPAVHRGHHVQVGGALNANATFSIMERSPRHGRGEVVQAVVTRPTSKQSLWERVEQLERQVAYLMWRLGESGPPVN